MSREFTSSAASLQTPQDRPPFQSILFERAEIDVAATAPEFFPDLHLDQVIASITAGHDEYNLRPFFYTLLSDVAGVNYRYDVFRDLENLATLASIRSFAGEMRSMRGHLALADKLYYKYQKEAWFLDAVEVYCYGVRDLSRELAALDLRSAGLQTFREYLTAYAGSNKYRSLVTETEKLNADLSRIRYSLHIDENRVEVGPCNSEPDYDSDVLETFKRFRQGAPRQYRFRFSSSAEMNHVEAAILDLVAQLHPETFAALNEYCDRNRDYLDNAIARFDREIQFYVAYVEHIARLTKYGLHFCTPIVSDRSKEVCGRDVFDVALANKLIADRKQVIANDFRLRGPERILVVTGPNQGGKTTFARTFGQLHYLAKIGCPVPGREGRLFLFDQLFTHFEREEDIHNLSGKLEDDLLRIHSILESATSNSILIMNESFLSTTLNDALFLSREIMQRIIQRDMLCVSVTFLDELASLGEATVSMVGTVDSKDPTIRTFKIIRKPADGLAYADALAQKYRLGLEDVKRRIASNGKGCPS